MTAADGRTRLFRLSERLLAVATLTRDSSLGRRDFIGLASFFGCLALVGADGRRLIVEVSGRPGPDSAVIQADWHCSIRATAGGLRVAYSLQNRDVADLGLFNRIPVAAPDGTVSLSPENVYSDLDGETLHVRKMVLAVPEGLSAAERPVPYVTRLAPQETFREEFLLPLPIRLNHPFRAPALTAPSAGSGVAPDTARKAERAIFSLGVFRSDAGIRFLPVSESHPFVYRVWPLGPCVDRQVVLTEAAALDTPVPVLAL